MRTRMFVMVSLLAPLAAGCGDSGTTDMAATTDSAAPRDMATPAGNDMATPAGNDMAMPVGNDMAMPVGGDMAMGPDMAQTFPAAPVLGDEIDRMGRPGVNTAMTDPFDPDMNKQAMTKEMYNQGNDPSMWVVNWTGAFIANLAKWDSLNGACGDQAGYDFPNNPRVSPPMTPVAAYGTLAAALADDELYVDTTQTTCSLYLAVELNTLTGGLAGKNDCGGRTLTANVIDETYSLVMTGQPAGVTNGVLKDADNAMGMASFPFLNAPNM